ncbi:SDR family oxidoreductase [Pseudomonas saliphila]|uniref:SDR family oxidoreductase n=1 Tax=Pseudomonas saliphila TaxID=2586906 RepID=UPI00123B6AFB|nr:SDR family oxidoreductase [Pseudomonas saliphila]
MDLDITGRKAIVCASSRGLGKACAMALAAEGCEVFINGRDAVSLNEAAMAIRDSTGLEVVQVVADLNASAGRDALLAACPAPDILITNNGGPAPGKFQDWDLDCWQQALEANMLSAILLIQAVVEGMRERRFGRIVNITSAMVKSPRLPMGLSTAARAGLTAFSKALSVEVIRDNVTINNLLPERIATDRLAYMTGQLAKYRNISLEEARAEMLRPVPARRFGTPEEFAAACAFLCAAQAGYITGQNLQLDGGAYTGLI